MPPVYGRRATAPENSSPRSRFAPAGGPKRAVRPPRVVVAAANLGAGATGSSQGDSQLADELQYSQCTILDEMDSAAWRHFRRLLGCFASNREGGK